MHLICIYKMTCLLIFLVKVQWMSCSLRFIPKSEKMCYQGAPVII